MFLRVGKNTVVIIDKSLVDHFDLTKENTFVQEEIVESGILLRIIREDEGYQREPLKL